MRRTRAKPGKFIEVVSMFGSNPCPWCGRDRKLYVAETTRGPKTKGGGHRPGERRVKRILRATCGRKTCKMLQRAQTLLGRHRRKS